MTAEFDPSVSITQSGQTDSVSDRSGGWGIGPRRIMAAAGLGLFASLTVSGTAHAEGNGTITILQDECDTETGTSAVQVRVDGQLTGIAEKDVTVEATLRLHDGGDFLDNTDDLPTTQTSAVDGSFTYVTPLAPRVPTGVTVIDAFVSDPRGNGYLTLPFAIADCEVATASPTPTPSETDSTSASATPTPTQSTSMAPSTSASPTSGPTRTNPNSSSPASNTPTGSESTGPATSTSPASGIPTGPESTGPGTSTSPASGIPTGPESTGPATGTTGSSASSTHRSGSTKTSGSSTETTGSASNTGGFTSVETNPQADTNDGSLAASKENQHSSDNTDEVVLGAVGTAVVLGGLGGLVIMFARRRRGEREN